MSAEKEFSRGFDEATFGASRKEVAEMSEIALARWQAGFQPGTAQYILADHEWQTRRIARQVRGAYFAAAIGLLGVLLGWALRSI